MKSLQIAGLGNIQIPHSLSCPGGTLSLTPIRGDAWTGIPPSHQPTLMFASVLLLMFEKGRCVYRQFYECDVGAEGAFRGCEGGGS